MSAVAAWWCAVPPRNPEKMALDMLLRALQKRGYNLWIPDHPNIKWKYWVIDASNTVRDGSNNIDELLVRWRWIQ